MGLRFSELSKSPKRPVGGTGNQGLARKCVCVCVREREREREREISHTRIHTWAHTLTYTHTHSLTHAHTPHTHSLTHSLKHTLTLTHTRTHAHTHAPQSFPIDSLHLPPQPIEAFSNESPELRPFWRSIRTEPAARMYGPSDPFIRGLPHTACVTRCCTTRVGITGCVMHYCTTRIGITGCVRCCVPAHINGCCVTSDRRCVPQGPLRRTGCGQSPCVCVRVCLSVCLSVCLCLCVCVFYEV